MRNKYRKPNFEDVFCQLTTHVYEVIQVFFLHQLNIYDLSLALCVAADKGRIHECIFTAWQSTVWVLNTISDSPIFSLIRRSDIDIPRCSEQNWGNNMNNSLLYNLPVEFETKMAFLIFAKSENEVNFLSLVFAKLLVFQTSSRRRWRHCALS